MTSPLDSEVRCSAKGCQLPAAYELLWRNPKIHTADRVKRWLACEDHRDTLADFLAGWKSGDFAKVGFVTADGTAIASPKVAEELKGLSGDMPQASLIVTAVGEPKVTGEIASNAIKLDWTLPNGAPWSYQSTVRMSERGSDGWRVVWEPAVVHSELTAGDRLELRTVAADRSTVLDRNGKPLITPRPVVTIALNPATIDDLDKLLAALAVQLKKVGVTIDAKDLRNRVEQATEGARVDVVTLRREDYVKIRSEVRPLKGTVFPEENRALAPSRMFARALLGTVDAATRDDIDRNPEVIRQGDLVGHGGLQGRYDVRLRGTAGQSVVIARKAPDGEISADQLYQIQPVAGAPVKTTLDVDVQNAADAAVAAEKQPSALVAVRISDSSVVAVSNGPDGGTTNTALSGQVPPGSTFKMVSAYGLLQKKAVTADTVVDCPKTKSVDGRVFKNAGDEVLGKVPFHVDFAESCNTAFVNLSGKLGKDGLASAAPRPPRGSAASSRPPTARPSWPRRPSARGRRWSARSRWPVPRRPSPAGSSSSPGWSSTRHRPASRRPRRSWTSRRSRHCAR